MGVRVGRGGGRRQRAMAAGVVGSSNRLKFKSLSQHVNLLSGRARSDIPRALF